MTITGICFLSKLHNYSLVKQVAYIYGHIYGLGLNLQPSNLYLADYPINEPYRDVKFYRQKVS